MGVIPSLIIVIPGLILIVDHFLKKGFDLNLNIVIFIFLIFGILGHKTPIRYVKAIMGYCFMPAIMAGLVISGMFLIF